MSATITVEYTGISPNPRSKPDDETIDAAPVRGRVPRLSQLMAIAIRLDELFQDGTLKIRLDAAELGYVSTSRITHITNLLSLAPDVQEEILFLPRLLKGRGVTEKHILPLTKILVWSEQRRRWAELKQSFGLSDPVAGSTAAPPDSDAHAEGDPNGSKDNGGLDAPA